MLAEHVDIRTVQELLGHEYLAATVAYRNA
jgi:site-specific recombinase XerC